MLDTKKYTLPTNEMREDMPSAFRNGDDNAYDLPLNSKAISEMAFRSVFMYQPGNPSKNTKIGK